MTLRNYIIIAALGSVLAVRAQEEPAAPVFRPPFGFPLTAAMPAPQRADCRAAYRAAFRSRR